MPRTDTVIILPVHNALEYVEQTCHRLDLYNPYVPIVVVDDHSEADTALWLDRWVLSTRQHSRQAALLVNARQQLFTRTVNRGIRYAWQRWQPGIVVVLNSDVELSHHWLANLKDALTDRPADRRIGIAGYPDSPDGSLPLVRQKRCPEYVTGHCIGLATAMLQEIGLFCETDLTGRDSPELAHLHGQAHIGSDRILNWRAQAAGWSCLELHHACLSHAAGKSWHHDLSWLSQFALQPLWPPTDGLPMPEGWTEVMPS